MNALGNPAVDGRRARRDRNRAAVIDAMFAFLEQGVLPSTEQIAGGAGVSVSSVFRYFESLEDLQQQTIEAYFERYGPLFEVASIGEGGLDQRIKRIVDARCELHSAVAPVARLARVRAIDQPLIAERLRETRNNFAAQVRAHFATELAEQSPAVADDTADAIDALTSFETWDLLTSTHRRTMRQVKRTWTSAIHSLLDAPA